MENIRKKLFNNRSFIVGIVALAFPVFLVFISFFVNMDATTVRAWAKYQKPMSSIPYILSENDFKVGEKVLPFWQVAKKSINLQIIPKTVSEYLVTEKNGEIIKIFDSSLGKKIDKLDLKNFQQTLKNGEIIDHHEPLILNIKEQIPEKSSLICDGNVLKLINVKIIGKIKNYNIELEDNRVSQILINDEPVSEINLSGKKIDNVLIDGKTKEISFLLGSDAMGRDLLSRIAYGGRISLMVGIVSTLISLIIGVSYGAISGYFGGKLDSIMMAWVNILYAVPFMFLVILLLVYVGNNVFVLFAALGAVQWLTMSRIVRTSVMNLKSEPYVLAAKMSGCNHWQTLKRHILPNIAAPIIIYTTLTVPAVILEESFLSFIGLSVQFNGMSLDSWGTLINQGVASIGGAGENFWLLIFPSLTMVFALLGFNFIGDGLREVLDPKSH